ncbi:MAG: protein kinase [Planctomycetota bacterium]|nr:protein kinase [Planctomycetota bacterium]
MSGVDHRLLDELAQEYVARLRRGEPVQLEEYVEARPELEAKIREIFPVLAMVEGLKPVSAKTVADATPSAAKAKTEPERIGPYVALREIGHGGMGRVYEAMDDQGHRVALKLIHAHLVDRPGYLARFLREADVGRRIEHDGLVRTLGADVVERHGHETPYLVLEFVEGQNLRELVDEVGPISERLCRVIAGHLSEALAAIHAAGVVHRDVKPENVVITPDETVKLMDLGVALLQDEAYRLSQTGEFVGSLLYAAPEQLRGDTPDARTDLYSLGILMYELVTGRHPESVGDATRPRARNLRDAIQPPSTHADGLSPFLDRVILRLLAADPDERFASAEELSRVLKSGEASGWWQRTSTEVDRLKRTRGGDERITRLVGRTPELRRLSTFLRDAQAGEGRVLLVRGEAGIGKSRLVHEWLDGVETGTGKGPHIIVAEHNPGGDTLDVPPLAAALRDLLGEDELEAKLKQHLGQSACLAEPLARHFRGEEAAAYGLGLPPAALGTAYLLLLRGLARERPLVLFFEDLHFAGESGRQTFLMLARSIQSDPILLVGTTRPEQPDPYGEAFERLDHTDALTLSPLTTEACHAIARDVLGELDASASGVAEIVKGADGNPFCVIEFARETRKQLRETPGGRARVFANMPTSVRRLLDMRLEALEPDLRDLLSVAACCGHRFDPVLVCDASDVPKIRGLRMFQELDRTHALVHADGALYRFHHHLVQELLYAELAKPLKAAYHTALGEALERRRVGADRDAESTDPHTAFELARHFLLSDEVGRALPYAVRGMRHVVDRGEFRRAERMASHVLAVGTLPDVVAGFTHYVTGLCRRASSNLRDAVRHFEKAHDLLQEDAPVAYRILNVVALASNLASTGRPEESVPLLREALGWAEAEDDPQLISAALLGLVAVLTATGHHEEATTLGERALAQAREAGNILAEARAGSVLGGLLVDRSRAEEAQLILEHAWLCSQMAADRYTEAGCVSRLGKLAYMRGDSELAHDLNRKCGAIGREIGHQGIQQVAAVNESNYLLDVGDIPGAIRQSRFGADLAERMGDIHYLANSLLMVARSLEADGRVEAARDTFLESLERARETDTMPLVLNIGSRMVPIHAFGGRPDEAEVWLERARDAAERLVGSTHVGLIALASADLAWAQGDLDAAFARLMGFLGEAKRRAVAGHMARLHLGIGLLAHQRAEPKLALEHLDKSIELAEPHRSLGLLTAARLVRAAVEPGDRATARILAFENADRIRAHLRVLSVHALATALDDDELRGLARTTLERIIENAPEAWQPAMRTDVPVYRAVLAD